MRNEYLIRFSIFLSFGMLILVSSKPALSQDWFDDDWQYRREINVTNPGTSELVEYQVQISLETFFNFNHAKTDGSDVRITTNDGVTLIPHWIEKWEPIESQAVIWTKLPFLPVGGTTINIYYGNSNPIILPPDSIEVPPIGPYTKNPNNSIVPIGDPENGEDLLAENIVYDSATGHFWMSFASYRGVFATGLVWSDDPTNPDAWNWHGTVISQCYAPHILKHEGIWYIFYADRAHGGPPYPISVSSSPNVDGPYTYIGPVLESSEPWEAFRVSEPYVIQRNDGKWILMYMGDSGGFIEQIGYAIADDLLGPYTKFAGNPCLAFGPLGSYDAGTIADPWVYEHENIYYIGYTVSPTNSSPWQTAFATTNDWQTFTKQGILVSTGSEFNTFRGAITRIEDEYVFSYTGGPSIGDYRMGIATQPVFQTAPEIINNGEAVFDFFDGFDGTSLDVSKWSIANGAASQTIVNNGLLTLSANTDFIKIIGTNYYGMGYTGETRAFHPDQGTQGLLGEVGFSDITWNVLRIVDNFLLGTTYWQRQAKLPGQPDEFFNMAQMADQEWHTFHIFRESPNLAGFQIDDHPAETTTGTVNTTVPTMDLPPFLMAYGDGSEFIVDWTRIRKWAGAEAVVSVSNEEFLSQGIDIAVYNTSCGKFDVTLKSDVNISDNSISNIQFTIKWPANTVNLLNFSSNYGVELQGNFFIENDTNFAIFVSATPIPINWSAESEYTILSFAHDQLGTGTTDFIIDTSEWASLNNGSFYVELLGTDRTGMVYQNAPDVFLGTCGILDLKIFLQGPYDASSSLMNTAINGDLPLVQPYSDAPWNYPGTETVVSMPANAVDWVLVELRDAPNATSANLSTRYDRQAALILEDGTILSVDGSSIDFNNATLQNLFVVLWHRNHLGVLSAIELLASPVDFYSYDFSTDVSNAFLDGQIELNTNVFGMISGDANANNTVDLLDIIQIWNSQAGNDGYFNGDLNLDKQVNNIDKNDYWYFNLFKGSKVPE